MTAGAPPLDWWNLSWDEVRERLLRSMCPEKVCRTCGAPSRRIVGEATYTGTGGAQPDHQFMRGGRSVAGLTHHSNSNLTRQAPTLGFTDCGHNDWRTGLVLEITGET